jgi:subtilisin family serine protease
MLGGTASPALADDPFEACKQSQSENPNWPTVYTQLGLAAALRQSVGAGITVAVVDSGVDATNPHLSASVVDGVDLVGSSDGKTDTYGLGTAVAAIIAARQAAGSSSKLQGVAPRAQIMPVRVYENVDEQKGKPIDMAKTAQGIIWAADRGAKVIVVPHWSTTNHESLAGAIAHARSKGASVVVAAGDATGDEANADHYPAHTDGAFTVAALDANGLPAAVSVKNAKVKISAPGGPADTTAPGAGDCQITEPSTSFAAAYVAGVAALVAAKYNPLIPGGITPDDLENRLMTSASRSSAIQEVDAISSYGWGVVSPYEALNYTGQPPGPNNPEAPTDVLPPVVIPDPVPDDLPETRILVAAILGATAAVGACFWLWGKRRKRA